MLKNTQPALTSLLEAEFEGKYEPRLTTVTTGTSSVVAVRQNFERLSLTISNFGAYDVTVSPDTPSVSGSGFVLGAGGGFMSVNWRSDMLLPGLEWFAISPTGSSSLFVVELTRYTGV